MYSNIGFSTVWFAPRREKRLLQPLRGPSGKNFNFTFHKRGTDEQLDELGRLMTNVCKLVPGGVVCFLASYGYLDQASLLACVHAVSCNTTAGQSVDSAEAVDILQVLFCLVATAVCSVLAVV